MWPRADKGVDDTEFVAIVRDSHRRGLPWTGRRPYGLQKSHSHLARFVQAFGPIIQVGS